MSLSPTYKSQEEAAAAGLVFVPAKVIEYVTDERDSIIGKVQRKDTSGPNQFGYEFGLAAYRKDPDGGFALLGIFGECREIFIEDAPNKGGDQGAYYTNVMDETSYNKALESARRAIQGSVA